MAKTKQEYETIGVNLFKDGKPRPEGTSWQVKAQQCGYDCAETDDYDARMDIAEEQFDRDIRVINNPLECHIRNLLTISAALSKDDGKGNKRFWRIMKKVVKLQQKMKA